MPRLLLTTFAAMALASAGAFAQTVVPAPTAPKPTDLMILTAEDIDSLRLLPPPPELNSDVQKAELAQLHQIEAQRTPARLDQAAWDDQHQNSSMYAELFGPKWDMDKLPATRKVMQTAYNDLKVAANRAKDAFKRPRPWVTDETLHGCAPDRKEPLSSYPSGHTTYAFATGVVLSDLMPDKAQAILKRDQDFGYSRMVCGVHYRSDIAGGETLGTVVGTLLVHSPKMQADLAAARAELKAAGLTP